MTASLVAFACGCFLALCLWGEPWVLQAIADVGAVVCPIAVLWVWWRE